MLHLINNYSLQTRIIAVHVVLCFPIPPLNNVVVPFVSNDNATPDVIRSPLGPKGRGA